MMFLKADGYLGPMSISLWRAWPWRGEGVAVDAVGRQDTRRGRSSPNMSDSVSVCEV